jgi:ATP-dependent DNA helicase RecG
MLVGLKTSLKNLTRIGQIVSGRLKNLGLKTVQDLLFYYPSRYEDYSRIVQIKDLKPEEKVTIQGQIISISNQITRYRRQKITQAAVSDGAGTIKIVWFNQPYLITQLRQGDQISLAGKIEHDGFGLSMRSPEWEKGRMGVHTAGLIPIYPLTQGLTQRQIRFLVSQALAAVEEIEEWLDGNVKCQISNVKFASQISNFLDLQAAVRNIHFPEDRELLSKARLRLKFDELFLLQIRKAITRQKIQGDRAIALPFKEQEIKNFVKSLPFKLTNAQRKSAWQILRDIEKPTPMNRLLQGDVGSGKTLVALIAMLNTALNNYQAVLMAPTEILAKQHFGTVCGLLKGFDVSVGLVTRSVKKLKAKSVKLKTTAKSVKLIKYIENGEVDVTIGTHALIQEKVKFKNLGLAIVDEQHRFGVEQRKALREKASPHFLSMTATPIPRSLSLTMYGDLDISVLDEMPADRKKIITRVVASQNRERAYDFIRKQIKKGRQVFVICPLIDESDKLGVRAVTVEFRKLDSQIFPNLKIGLLHGKLKAKEKDEAQEKFVKGELDILVATSVVEVGVNVPNASVMMIEGADRFGLSQLHQFRGRVGRSQYQSYCFLFTDSNSQNVYERLEFLSQTSDGFKIAEFDLQLRGAGNVYGTEQHGLLEFKIASLQDYKLIELTQGLARQLIEKSPTLGAYPSIKKKIEQIGGVAHLE